MFTLVTINVYDFFSFKMFFSLTQIFFFNLQQLHRRSAPVRVSKIYIVHNNVFILY